MSYETMLKNIPRFKAFCRRTITAEPMPTWEERFTLLKKKHKSEIATFCRPRGVNSILKEHEYTTGRLIRVFNGDEDDTGWICEERAKIRRGKLEWNSEIQGDHQRWEEVAQDVPPFGLDSKPSDEERLLALVEEQNRLLRSIVEGRKTA